MTVTFVFLAWWLTFDGCHCCQATLYKMAQRVLAENAGVETVRYVLPNKHYIPVDMKYIGVDNTTPYVCFFSGVVCVEGIFREFIRGD